MFPSVGMLLGLLRFCPQPVVQTGIEKIRDRELDVRQGAFVREQSHNTHAGSACRGDADGRILKDDAIGRLGAEFVGGFQENVGCGLGMAHLGTIDDDLEMRAKCGAVEDEIDIGTLGIAGKSHGQAGGRLQERANAGDELLLQLIAHELAVEALFGGAMLLYAVQIGRRAEKVQHDVIISASVHAGEEILIGNAQGFEIFAPSELVDGHGIDDHAIHVKNEGYRGKISKKGGRSLIKSGHLDES